MKCFNWRTWCVFTLVIIYPFFSSRAATPDPSGTNGLIGSWSFYDTNTWLSDYEYPPVSFTNLSSLQLNGINCLVMDSTNASRLQFNVVEGDSHTNLTVAQGTILFW